MAPPGSDRPHFTGNTGLSEWGNGWRGEAYYPMNCTKNGYTFGYGGDVVTCSVDLVGQTVVSIGVDDEQHLMTLRLAGGSDIILTTEGDCCSESWFADFLGVDALLNQPIEQFEEIELPDYTTDDGRGRQDFDRVYGYRFTTPRGYADLIFRNSSNGYYGGEMHMKEGKYPETLAEITKDWKA